MTNLVQACGIIPKNDVASYLKKKSLLRSQSLAPTRLPSKLPLKRGDGYALSNPIMKKLYLHIYQQIQNTRQPGYNYILDKITRVEYKDIRENEAKVFPLTFPLYRISEELVLK